MDGSRYGKEDPGRRESGEYVASSSSITLAMGSRVPMGNYNSVQCTVAKMGRSFGDRAFFSELDPGSFLLNPDSEVDVAVFFDCCYSFLATRTINPLGRVVEVLAAVDAKSKTANCPGKRVSFTGKMATKVAFLRGQGREHIDLAELITILRTEDSPVKTPCHMLRVGLSSIRLRFPPSASIHTAIQLSTSNSTSSSNSSRWPRLASSLPHDG
jgi:hypothetical protein